MEEGTGAVEVEGEVIIKGGQRRENTEYEKWKREEEGIGYMIKGKRGNRMDEEQGNL